LFDILRFNNPLSDQGCSRPSELKILEMYN